MARVDLDVTAWPLVQARIPATFDVEAIDSFFRGFDEVLARKTKFVTSIDTSALSRFPDALERSHLGECMKVRTFAEASYNLGNAVILRSATARTVLTAVNWVRRPVTAQQLVGTFAEALEWCCGRLAQAGIPLSPAIEMLRAHGAGTSDGKR
ncbi:MAG TPA: hypothetical protein VGI39_28105 [Polyangiaceae bacterium]|jgi:hypothetical protein